MVLMQSQPTDGTVRSRRLLRGVTSSVLSRGLAALAPLVTVPIALNQLGAEGYGAWSAALALTAFAVFADLGLGVGLMTRLAKALAHGDPAESRSLVSSGYAAVGSLVAVLMVALMTSTYVLDWAAIVGGERGDRGVENIVVVTIALFLANAVVSLIVRIQYAAQQIERSNLWQAAGALAGVAAVLLSTIIAPGHVGFILLATGTPILVGLVNTAAYFCGSGKSFAPRLFAVSPSHAASLIRLGARYLLISSLMGVALSTDNWIVGQTHSLAEVPEFAIPARVFALLGVLTSIITVPLWPTNVEAMQQGDSAWVEATTKRMVWIATGAVGLSAIAFVIAAPRAISWWLDGGIEPPMTLLAGLGVWAVVQATVAPLFMVQNAAEVLMPQIVGYAVLLLVLPLKWLVSTRAGFEWIPWVSVLGYLVIIWPIALRGYRSALQSVVVSTRGAE